MKTSLDGEIGLFTFYRQQQEDGLSLSMQAQKYNQPFAYKVVKKMQKRLKTHEEQNLSGLQKIQRNNHSKALTHKSVNEPKKNHIARNKSFTGGTLGQKTSRNQTQPTKVVPLGKCASTPERQYSSVVNLKAHLRQLATKKRIQGLQQVVENRKGDFRRKDKINKKFEAQKPILKQFDMNANLTNIANHLRSFEKNMEMNKTIKVRFSMANFSKIKHRQSQLRETKYPRNEKLPRINERLLECEQLQNKEKIQKMLTKEQHKTRQNKWKNPRKSHEEPFLNPIFSDLNKSMFQLNIKYLPESIVQKNNDLLLDNLRSSLAFKNRKTVDPSQLP